MMPCSCADSSAGRQAHPLCAVSDCPISARRACGRADRRRREDRAHSRPMGCVPDRRVRGWPDFVRQRLSVQSGPGGPHVRGARRCRREARRAACDTCRGEFADTVTRRPMARVSDECVRHRRDARRTTDGFNRIRASLDPWRQSHSLESRRGHAVFPRRRNRCRRRHRPARAGVDIEARALFSARPTGVAASTSCPDGEYAIMHPRRSRSTPTSSSCRVRWTRGR